MIQDLEPSWNKVKKYVVQTLTAEVIQKIRLKGKDKKIDYSIPWLKIVLSIKHLIKELKMSGLKPSKGKGSLDRFMDKRSNNWLFNSLIKKQR